MTPRPPNQNTTSTQHTQSTQQTQSTREAVDSVHRELHPCYLPTPVWIPQDAFWVCICDKRNRFEDTSKARPLGRMYCEGCTKAANFNTAIHNVELTRLQYNHYMVSLPGNTSGLPMTIFGNVCCRCGRSHLRPPRPMATIKDPKPAATEKESLGKRLIKAARKTFHTDRKEDDQPSIYHGGHIDEELERRAFTVQFSKPCTCLHEPCDLCLKFKVEGPLPQMEWVAQAVEATDQLVETHSLPDIEAFIMAT
ncbi:hypothetical protein P154DRAFT_583170 [Amniculicola lignicola CBS 123094]|uniref:Probable double zinc ribbon domain-containing protein n=1 Tax=Amniculicola lignicola CBS 123094 TaxID=1392246 RepID=A0A6A5VVQ5_9PLEO|nr:hypothetical protein P154DRAFT_583170 [Amniculicola lignicola CBS 123094]